jgi:hypothetical protein
MFAKTVWIQRTIRHRAHLHLLGTAAATGQAFPPDGLDRGVYVRLTIFGTTGHLKTSPIKTRLIGKNTKTEPEIAGKTGHFCVLSTLKKGNASLGNTTIFRHS